MADRQVYRHTEEGPQLALDRVPTLMESWGAVAGRSTPTRSEEWHLTPNSKKAPVV